MVGTQERFDWENGKDFNGTPSVDDLDVALGTGSDRPENSCNTHDNTYSLRWAVGRQSYRTPSTPAAYSIYYGLPYDSNGIHYLEKDQVYDVVLQNYPTCN
eukprot:UN29091